MRIRLSVFDEPQCLSDLIVIKVSLWFSYWLSLEFFFSTWKKLWRSFILQKVQYFVTLTETVDKKYNWGIKIKYQLRSTISTHRFSTTTIAKHTRNVGMIEKFSCIIVAFSWCSLIFSLDITMKRAKELDSNKFSQPHI